MLYFYFFFYLSSQNQFNRIGSQESTNPKVNIPVLPQSQQESDENNSSSSSDTESQLSSLGPWGDDPEIQEKVKYVHKDAFWFHCSRRLLKTLWQKEKLLQTINFSVCHNDFNFFLELYHHFMIYRYFPCACLNVFQSRLL